MQSGTDWVACGQCHRWQHIACDPRAGVSDLKQFADSGKMFSCVDCSKIKAEQSGAATGDTAAPGTATAPVHGMDAQDAMTQNVSALEQPL